MQPQWKKNLQEYLKRHPDCELYHGQDSHVSPEEKKAIIAAQNRIAIWNTVTKRRVSGNAAPSEKKLGEYLRKHPECEVYNGQDKRPAGAPPRMPGHHPSVTTAQTSSQPPVSAAVPVPINNSTEGPMFGGQTQTQPMAMPGTMGNMGGMGNDFSIADMFGSEYSFSQADMLQDELLMAGSLSKMSGPAHSLEDMFCGMSLDEMDALMSAGSLGNDPFGSLNDSALDGMVPEPAGGTIGQSGRSVACPVPMSPAQRIKRDRAISVSGQLSTSVSRPQGSSLGSLAGSQLSHPAQRMRQGPGPGSVGASQMQSLGSTPDLMDLWSMSPGNV